MEIFSTNRSLSLCAGGKVSKVFSNFLICWPIRSRFFWRVSAETAEDKRESTMQGTYIHHYTQKAASKAVKTDLVDIL